LIQPRRSLIAGIALKNTFSHAILFSMTVTQTVEILADRRITLEVPIEVPIGKASLEYKIVPFANKTQKPRMTETEEIEWINSNAEWLNEEAMINLSCQSWNPLKDEV